MVRRKNVLKLIAAIYRGEVFEDYTVNEMVISFPSMTEAELFIAELTDEDAWGRSQDGQIVVVGI